MSSMTTRAMLEAVLSATPEPPKEDADPMAVIETALRVVSQREPLMGLVRKLLSSQLGTDVQTAELLGEILDREVRWSAALAEATEKVRGVVETVSETADTQRFATHADFSHAEVTEWDAL